MIGLRFLVTKSYKQEPVVGLRFLFHSQDDLRPGPILLTSYYNMKRISNRITNDSETNNSEHNELHVYLLPFDSSRSCVR